MSREHHMTFILAGRSGSGKSTMADILESELSLHRCVTSTTRPPRAGEEDGRTYHFLPEMDKSKMFECAVFGGHWYGASFEELEKSDFIILEPQGVEYYRNHFPTPLAVIQLERDGVRVSPERMARDKAAGFDNIKPDYIVRGETILEMAGNLIPVVKSIISDPKITLQDLITCAEQKKQTQLVPDIDRSDRLTPAR